VAITVEGANILTRSLIIFGQGAIRCHPYLLREMEAVRNPDAEAGLIAFDKALFAHIGHDIANFTRTFWHGLTLGRFASAPAGAGDLAPHYRALSHASARLAVVSEMALGILGGALKRKESLSARLGDILSEIYLLCAAIKRFETDGRRASDRPVLDWCMQWEHTLGDIAVFNRYGDGIAPSEFRLFLHGLGTDAMGGRSNYVGYWTAESGANNCAAGLIDPMGTTTYDWGTVELVFDRSDFPSGWTAQIGYCVDPREEEIRAVAPAAGAVK